MYWLHNKTHKDGMADTSLHTLQLVTVSTIQISLSLLVLTWAVNKYDDQQLVFAELLTEKNVKD